MHKLIIDILTAIYTFLKSVQFEQSFKSLEGLQFEQMTNAVENLKCGNPGRLLWILYLPEYLLLRHLMVLLFSWINSRFSPLIGVFWSEPISYYHVEVVSYITQVVQLNKS